MKGEKGEKGERGKVKVAVRSVMSMRAQLEQTPDIYNTHPPYYTYALTALRLLDSVTW